MRSLFTLLACCLLIGSTSAQTPPIRILPLGDSITFGSGAAGGYRNKLYQTLTAAGYDVDFVGTQTGNGVASLPDLDHEGHGGWRIDQLDANVAGWFNAFADPDVILLHIGTNDFGQAVDTINAINRLDNLITKMAALRPYAHIIVTNLMERGEPQNTQIQEQFNPFVQERVNGQVAMGRRVTFLDMRAAVPLSDMPDNLHPNQAGYDKMADAWLPAIQSVISANGDFDPPFIAWARGNVDRTHVAITFSKPVADSAANLANYAISGGLTISAAELDASKRIVTLTTSAQTIGSIYTITVNGVNDRMDPAASSIAPNSTINFQTSIPRGYLNNVAEAAGYTLAYSLDVPTAANFLTTAVPYSVDNRNAIGPFSRVAYYVELQSAVGELQYLWASMDSFTTDVNKIAVPTLASGAVFQQPVNGLTVASNVPGITTGNNLAGNLEFWPTNYSAGNAAGIAGASDVTYDFGDTQTPGGNYGSMQLHSAGAAQTLFAFNNWGGNANAGNVNLGIGNQPTGNPDWTFAANGAAYAIKTIQVLVQTSGDLVPPNIAAASASFGQTQVTVTFSEPIFATSVQTSNFTLDNGVAVLGAAVSSNQRDVILTTTAQPTGTPLTLTVTGVRDSSPNANLIIPGSSIVVSAPLLPPEIVSNIGAAATGYHLVYSLDIPAAGNFNAAGANAYKVNDQAATGLYSRVAYYLELQRPGGPVQYVWTSMDAFTPSRRKLGIPTFANGAIFQRTVTNLDVLSNVPGITTGSGIATGNIEFWPTDYSAPNAAAVPNASASAFDFGDTRSTAGGFGSMQVHNHGASQTLFAINHFGIDGSTLDLGIGNQPTGNPDWTFAANASGYSRRVLHVLVLPGTSTPPAITANVPESASYQLAATVNIPAAGNLNNANIYSVDVRNDVGPFSRIAYYMELKKPADAASTFVWTSMDAFTADPAKIGVPTTASNAFFQQNVTNLNVVSNVAGVVNGSNIATGNLEFWASNYNQVKNAASPANASEAFFDFGDSGGSTAAGHGSMQVHNYGESQTLFSITNWGSINNQTNKFGMGIGNNPTPTNGATDWTFAANSDLYSTRVLHIFVLPAPDVTGPTIAGIRPSIEGNRLVITFNEPVADSAANTGNFTIDNGITVTGARLLSGNLEIALSTSALTAGVNYTVTVNGLRDRSPAGNPVAPGTNGVFTAVAAPTVFSNVPEIANYKLIYQLAIPSAVPRWNFNPLTYSVDESKYGEQGFDRVAYLMELDSEWVYVSFDAITNSISKIGVPTLNVSATPFQQNVAHMNVASNKPGIVTGTDLPGGNIEFWGGNYAAPNSTNVPNASGTTFDFGDQMSAGGHGSMQVHNHDASQVLFGYNNWGSNATGISDLGIGNHPNPSTTNANPQLDWTFASNANTYGVKNLYVLARPAPIVPSGPTPRIFAHPTSRTINAGSSTTLAVGVNGSGPFTYQWRFGSSPISGATNPWLELTSVTAGQEGIYDVVVTGPGGASSTSLSATLTVNQAPTFAGYRFTARKDAATTISLNAILGKAGDLDGDTLAVTNANTPTTAGGTTQLGVGSITYTPPAGFAGTDTFTVTISDGQGGSASGLVQATISSLMGNQAGDSTIARREDGKVETLFGGIAGSSYIIERNIDLTDVAGWTEIASGIVGDDGLIPFLDNNPPADRAFYRVRPGL